MPDPVADGAPSTQWREIIPPGEEADFARDAEIIRRYQHGFARSGDGQTHRGFHVKSHAGVEATFRVLPDIPAYARHGLFAKPATYAAWAKLSNGFSTARSDWIPDMVGFSVKLRDVPGARALPEDTATTQDFLALNQPTVPAEDARTLLIMSTASANLLTAPFRMLRGLGLSRTWRILSWVVGWTPRRLLMRSVATEDFHGLAPFTIGPHAAKFSWRSRQSPPAVPVPDASWRNYLREELAERLRHGDLVFDFTVQFYIDDKSTPLDGAFAWSGPSIKLAELTIPSCDLDAEDAKRTEHTLNSLSFTPWHALAAHRPIGNIMRGRRVIYSASSRNWGRQDDPSAGRQEGQGSALDPPRAVPLEPHT